jgi:crotonobetainyl-CoA:carnitine CoA-transferase CaiB-like acyl-CoA transferase
VSEESTQRDKPLQGVRVLDLGQFWAGPYTGRMLADAGAEVIKIESQRRPDILRLQARGVYPDRVPGEHPWNRSGMVNERNRNKYGLCLDLTMPEGRDVFKRLAAISDLVIENFSLGVMEGFGLGYPVLHRINPRLVMLSLTSQGLTGPESRYSSYGTTLEQIAGLFGITGYPHRTPGFSSTAFPDPLAAMLGLPAALVALREARRTGRGRHVEISQRELTTHVIGEAVMERMMTGRTPKPIGNRSKWCAPQGAYRCAGEDMWVVLTVTSDSQWTALCRVLARPELAHDERYASVVGRFKHHDEIDAVIEEWTQNLEHREAARLLQAAGIPAGPVLNVAELHEDPHLAARGFFEPVEDPEAGQHRYIARPFKLLGTPLGSYSPTPLLGQHNAFILGNLLGMTSEEIAGLEERGVIGTTPRGSATNG